MTLSTAIHPRLYAPRPAERRIGRYVLLATVFEAAMLAGIIAGLRPGALPPNEAPAVRMAFEPPAPEPPVPQPEPETQPAADPAPAPPEAQAPAPEQRVAEESTEPTPVLTTQAAEVARPTVPLARPKPPRPHKVVTAAPAAEEVAPVAQAAPPTPRPARLPAPAASPSPAAEASFEARIRAAVQAAAYGAVPPAAKMMELSGRAQVAFVYRAGSVSGERLVQSAGAGMLDDAALKAVRRASYPPPPPDIGGKALSLAVWVTF